jgi:Tol biopolymer transport system component
MTAGRILWIAAPAFFLFAAALQAETAAQPCTVDRATGTTIDKQPFLENAGGVEWNAATNRIAFNAKNTQGYYRVYITAPREGAVEDLTVSIRNMPTKHQGAPYWHPSGRYIVLVAEKQSWHGAKKFGNVDYDALPGFGAHADLWLVATDGSRAWQLTNETDSKNEGELIPIFSPDGKRLAWAERQSDGKYKIKVADFVESPEPHLANVRTFAPGGPAHYVPGSFSSNSKWLLYASDQDAHDSLFSQIYRLDVESGDGLRLTFDRELNGHPVDVATPGGEWIVYMSTLGVSRKPKQQTFGTEWYAMRLDGTGNKRLTSMNAGQRSNPEYSPVPLIAVKAAPSPAGDSFLGDVEDGIIRQSGFVEMMRLTCN